MDEPKRAVPTRPRPLTIWGGAPRLASAIEIAITRTDPAKQANVFSRHRRCPDGFRTSGAAGIGTGLGPVSGGFVSGATSRSERVSIAWLLPSIVHHTPERHQI